MANGLGDRVRQRADAANGGGAGEVATREPKTLAAQVREMHEQFAMAMPKGAEATQLIRDALSLLKTTPHLAECTAESVLGGLMTFAQLGLRPGVMGQGWLLPFRNWKENNRYEAQIVIGYKGYAELIHRTGSMKMVGRAVHENDLFEIEYGIEDRLRHKPPTRGGRGPVIGYYSVIKPTGSTDATFWYMTREECIEWRNAFAMAAKRDFKTKEVTGGSGPWFDEEKGPDGGTGFDSMAIKTTFLRAARWVQKTTDMTVARAIEADGAVSLNLNPADTDAVFNAEHPEPPPGDYIDGEVVEPPAATAPPARERAATRPAAPASPAAEPADDVSGEATQGQHRKIMALIGKHLVGDAAGKDAHRHAVLGGILARPIGSGKNLTAADADRVFEVLRGWDGDKTLIARVTGMAPAGDPAGAPAGDARPAPAGDGAGEPPAGDLPTPGSRQWHEDGHPVVLGNGQVERVPDLMNGDCAICSDPRDDEEGQG